MTDSILDDLFHACALQAWLEQAFLEQGPPDENATRLRAFRLYEEAVRKKNEKSETKSAKNHQPMK